MFLAKRGHPNILTGISFLSTRVQNPKAEDWDKLVRILSYLKNTKGIILSLEANNIHKLRWYVDTSFVEESHRISIHTGTRSHL